MAAVGWQVGWNTLNVDGSGNVTVAGNLTVARVLFSANGSAALPSAAWPDGQGFYAETTAMISAAVGALRYWRARAGGVDVLNAVMTGGQYLVVTGSLNAELTGTTDDLALTAVGRLRLTTSGGAQILTSVTGGTGGRKLLISNVNAVGSDNVTLEHEAATGTAANKFNLSGGQDLVIAPRGAVLVEYDSTLSRWVVAQP